MNNNHTIHDGQDDVLMQSLAKLTELQVSADRAFFEKLVLGFLTNNHTAEEAISSANLVLEAARAHN